ncbi:hypothetical protein BDZ97DRAFT_2056598, partial [Flammula alnicola]
MSDYTVTRKRTRYAQAVDPCLGYYLRASDKAENDRHNSELGDCNDENAELVVRNSWRKVVVPSSYAGELELERYLATDVDVDMDQEEEEESLDATNWSEFVPFYSGSRRRPIVPETPISTSSAAETGCADNNIPAQRVLTVEDFLKRSGETKLKAQKVYRRKRLRKTRSLNANLNPNLSQPAQARNTDSAEQENDSDSESDAIQLRSRKISRGALSEVSSSDFGTSSPRHTPPLSSPGRKTLGSATNRKKTRKRRKTLKERLYEAAVSTHGDPDTPFIQQQDGDDQTRIPLRFFPESVGESNGDNYNGLGPSARRKQNWSLVDPRKSKAIRTASFSSKIRAAPRVASNSDEAVLANTLDRLPMEKWRWDTHPSPEHYSTMGAAKFRKLSGKRPQDEIVGSVIAGCPPLAFVSVHEAEHSYRTMFHCQRPRDTESRPKNDKSTPSPPGLRFTQLKYSPNEKGTPSQVRSIDPPQLCMVQVPEPLQPLVQKNCSTHPPDDCLSSNSGLQCVGDASCKQSPAIILQTLCESYPAHSSPSPTILPRPFPAAVQQTPKQCGLSAITSNKLQDSVTNDSSRLGTLNGLKEIQLSTGLPVPATKRLRPLVSFMDEFLENIRSVNGTTAQPRQKTKKRLPSFAEEAPIRETYFGKALCNVDHSERAPSSPQVLRASINEPDPQLW